MATQGFVFRPGNLDDRWNGRPQCGDGLELPPDKRWRVISIKDGEGRVYEAVKAKCLGARKNAHPRGSVFVLEEIYAEKTAREIATDLNGGQSGNGHAG